MDYLRQARHEIEHLLDLHNFAAASHIYVVASVAYKEVVSSGGDTGPAEKLWALVSPLTLRICEDSRACLASDTEDGKAFTGALVALALLETRSPMQLFVEFLDLRKSALASVLRRANSSADGILALFVRVLLF